MKTNFGFSVVIQISLPLISSPTKNRTIYDTILLPFTVMVSKSNDMTKDVNLIPKGGKNKSFMNQLLIPVTHKFDAQIVLKV